MSKQVVRKKIVNIFLRIVVDILLGTPTIMLVASVLIASHSQSFLLLPIKTFFDFSAPRILKMFDIICERDMVACGIIFLTLWCILGFLTSEIFRFFYYCYKKCVAEKRNNPIMTHDYDVLVGICNTDSLFAFLVFFATLREIKSGESFIKP